MTQPIPAQPPVLIIGAGVAGLTLAQGLHRHSVPFRIFERHARSHIKQGHRFRISRDGQAALNSVLSPQLQGLLERTAAERHRFAPRYVDARKLDFAMPEPVDPADSMPVDRTWFRMLASLELQDSICYEKEFCSYETVDGLVHVRFTDGSVARGGLLVGADGIKSRVRRQLQPDRKLLDLERWVMWGRTPMTDDLQRALDGRPDLLSWCMSLDHESNVQTVVEPMTWSRSVCLESEAKMPEFSDYVYWVVCTAPSQYAEGLPKTVQEKKIYLARVSETWHPALQHLLASATHELSACVPILSSKPDIRMCSAGQTGRVTLIGDAAHPMSPMGGSGGDTAIQSAADLARTIAEGFTESSINGFEARMEARAKERIEHSFTGGQKFWYGKEWTEYTEVDV